jgi:hypothetical protein
VQLAGDANLAAALAPHQKRYLGVRLMVDWARNGLYTDVLSDLSAFVDEWDIDRQLSGVVPDELQTTEGYSTAKLTIKLAGNYVDGAGVETPLWKIFSPYGGFGTYGTGGAVNTPMYLQVVVRSPLGVWNVDQFTGWIDSATPTRASGTVTMVCLDGGGQLESGQTLHRWAADAYRRETLYDSAFTNGGESGEAGTIAACWLIDSMLRRAGFYEGPPWHPLATCAWTMRGSALPEIGAWNQITQWNFTNVWSFGMINSTPHLGPAMQTPGEVYSKTKGLYGPAYKDRYSLGNWKATGNRYLTKLTSGAQASTWLGYDQFGSNNSNILGFAGWFYFDSAEASDPWTVSQFFLSAYHQNFSGSDQYPANMTVTSKGKTRTIVMEINNEGATKNWKWTTTVTSNGWHYFSGAVTVTPTGVLGSTWLDGVQVFNQTNGGLASSLGTLAYQWIEGATNTVLLSCEQTCQYLQWIGAWNTTIGAYVQPQSTPPTTPRSQAKVDLAGQRLLWFPDIDQDAAGDIIQKVVAADLGAFYFTEQGVATFDSRATIKARQLTANSVFDVTIDTATDLAPVSAYVSVANRIGYTAAVKLAEPYRTVYEASKADQFLTQPGQAPRYNVSLSDVQAFWNGSVPPLTFPQGYDPGLSPPTLYWQQYMQYYTPSYYNNGLCLYVPNTRPSNGPPPPAVQHVRLRAARLVQRRHEQPAHADRDRRRLHVGDGARGRRLDGLLQGRRDRDHRPADGHGVDQRHDLDPAVPRARIQPARRRLAPGHPVASHAGCLAAGRHEEPDDPVPGHRGRGRSAAAAPGRVPDHRPGPARPAGDHWLQPGVRLGGRHQAEVPAPGRRRAAGRHADHPHLCLTWGYPGRVRLPCRTSRRPGRARHCTTPSTKALPDGESGGPSRVSGTASRASAASPRPP